MTIPSFVDAFLDQGGSCQGQCNCGKQFYAPNGDFDWFEGELEELTASNAIPVADYVSFIVFEGRQYVYECDCWQERAERIMNFLDAHAYQIAKYLTLEKRRKQTEADSAPEVQV